MKTKTLIILTVLALVLLVSFMGCKKTDEQKVADANATAMETQQDANNAANQSDAEKEWLMYKSAAESKIAEHEKIIAVYKAKMTNASGKLQASYDKKIDALELKNKELKAKLYDYRDEGNTKWTQFKNEFDNDLSELGSALKGFVVNDK